MLIVYKRAEGCSLALNPAMVTLHFTASMASP